MGGIGGRDHHHLFCGTLEGFGSPCLQPRPLCGTTAAPSRPVQPQLQPLGRASSSSQPPVLPAIVFVLKMSAHPPSRSVNVRQNSCFGFKTQLKYFLWDSPSFFLLAWHHAGASAWALGPHPTPGPGNRLLGKPVLSSPGSCCPPELGGLLLV